MEEIQFMPYSLFKRKMSKNKQLQASFIFAKMCKIIWKTYSWFSFQLSSRKQTSFSSPIRYSLQWLRCKSVNCCCSWIYTAFNDNPTLETCEVFWDMSKAFDKAWHTGLFYILESMGVSGDLLKIIKDFLNNKFQCFAKWPDI